MSDHITEAHQKMIDTLLAEIRDIQTQLNELIKARNVKLSQIHRYMELQEETAPENKTVAVDRKIRGFEFGFAQFEWSREDRLRFLERTMEQAEEVQRNLDPEASPDEQSYRIELDSLDVVITACSELSARYGKPLS